MKKLIFKLLPVFFILISFHLLGQQPDYPTKKINGVEYYLYTVQPGEGLYSISKKFNISQAEINDLNPQILSGLKSGQEIIVPVIHKNTDNNISVTPNKEKPAPTEETETKYITHIVSKKQTLFAISRKYNISMGEIRKHNPEIENGLQEGMILRIPKETTSKALKNNGNAPSKESTEKIKTYYDKKSKDTIKYIEHKVKEKETLYSISRLYNIEVSDIIRLNPKSEEKLKIGSKLKIIRKTAATPTKKDTVIAEKPNPAWSEAKIYTRIYEPVKPNKTPFRIAFLLPFMLENAKTDPANEKFIDFYAGALLAINEAKEFGISFEIFTFDTEKNEEKITEVLNNPELKTMDFIIGPAYTNQIPFVSDFAKENKINTLIPFSSKVYDVTLNPYLFQFNPGIDVEVKFVGELLRNEFKNDNIVFCNIQSISVLDDGYEFAFELQNELRKTKRNFKKVEIFTDQSIDFTNVIEKNKKNIVFFNTDKYSLISNYLDTLDIVGKSNDILLFVQYSWQNINTANLKSFSIAPFKSDINEAELKKYNHKFSDNYDWKPASNTPRYDLLGYDLTNYFIALMYHNGINFNIKKNKLPVSMGIQSQLKFERTIDKTGFTNKQLYFLQTKN